MMTTALATGACSDPAVGIWHGSFMDGDGDVAWEMELSLDAEGAGRAQISADSQGVNWAIDYDVDWKKTSRRQYEISLACNRVTTEPALGDLAPTCEDFPDGDLTCRLNRAKDDLACEDEDPVVLHL